jgi:hypothetical protein
MLITNLSVYRHFAAESATPQRRPSDAHRGDRLRIAVPNGSDARLLFEPMAAWSASRALADDDLRDPV